MTLHLQYGCSMETRAPSNKQEKSCSSLDLLPLAGVLALFFNKWAYLGMILTINEGENGRRDVPRLKIPS